MAPSLVLLVFCGSWVFPPRPRPDIIESSGRNYDNIWPMKNPTPIPPIKGTAKLNS